MIYLYLAFETPAPTGFLKITTCYNDSCYNHHVTGMLQAFRGTADKSEP